MFSFSGIDCSGKSTQIELVSKYLGKRGVKHIIIHSRVGYTPLLEFCKNLIRSDKNSSKDEQNEYRERIHSNSKKRALLLYASILDLGLYYGIYFRVVELFGKTILADRYFWDSYIDLKMKYPEINFEKWLVWKFSKSIYLKPQKSVIYTIPAEMSVYRSSLKDEPWPEDLNTRVARINKYMFEIANNRWKYEIDATKSVEEVFKETCKVLGL